MDGHLKNLRKFYSFTKCLWNPESLCILSKLEKIQIRCSEDLHFTPFLRQSASAQALRHLEIYSNCTIDKSFIDGLSRFHHLRFLTLSSSNDPVNAPIIDWPQLRQLNELAELDLNNVETGI